MKIISVVVLLFWGLKISAQQLDVKRQVIEVSGSKNLSSTDFNNLIFLIDNLKYRNVLRETTFLLKANPDEPLLYYFKGFIYNNLRKSNKAIQNLKIAISMDSTRYEFYREIGAALNEKKNYKEALKYLNKSVELKNDDEYVFVLKSFAKSGLFDYSGALLEIEKALELNPKGKFYLEFELFLKDLLSIE